EGRYPKGRINGRLQYGHIFGRTFEDVENKLNGLSVYPLESADIETTATFETMATEWLQAQKPQLKASSVAKYTNILQSYLVPQYGKEMLCSISHSDVMLYSRELLVSGGVKSNGLAPKTVNSIISVMKSIFEYAEREKSLPRRSLLRARSRQTRRLSERGASNCFSRRKT
ncbi:MAG: hypothetical protein IK046_06065, partial [Clostridia bacterium]|nr:hypothetical protein [Clostridia bacterium]